MAEKEAKFSANGGQLEVEIVVGENKRGGFEIVLFDKKNKNLLERRGNTSTASFLIGEKPSSLDGALLLWNVSIKASTDKPGQKWAVTLTIKQDGQPIENGVIPNDGTFNLVTIMDDRVRLRAK